MKTVKALSIALTMATGFALLKAETAMASGERPVAAPLDPGQAPPLWGLDPDFVYGYALPGAAIAALVAVLGMVWLISGRVRMFWIGVFALGAYLSACWVAVAWTWPVDAVELGIPLTGTALLIAAGFRLHRPRRRGRAAEDELRRMHAMDTA